MAARAKNRKTCKMTSPQRPIGRFQHNLIEMFFGWPSTKIAKMVPLRWTKWPSEQKIKKPFKQYLLLGQWADFKIISQECSLDDPLPVLLKWFCSAEQMAVRAKKKEKRVKWHLVQGQWVDFKIISQKCSLLTHLSTKCSWWAIVISQCPSSVVRRPSFVVNNLF